MKVSWRFAVALVLIAASASTIKADAAERILAKAILEMSGVKAGFCVHLGCGDGKLTADLVREGKFLIHGLGFDREKVAKARQLLHAQKIYGQASVEFNSLEQLPYEHDIVNLIVVDDLPKLLKNGVSFQEIMRVLCPNGIALLGKRDSGEGDALLERDLKAKLTEAGIKKFQIVKQNGLWAKIEKPRPKEMDDWTHRGYDATNTAVSKDKALKMISDFRWIRGPYWDAGAVAGAVSSGGRLFYFIYDDMLNFNKTREEVSVRPFLVARDAYNGSRLWALPTRKRWASGLLLVAVADRVYTVVGQGEVVALDGATGKTVTTYETGAPPLKLLVHRDNLIVFDRRSTRAYDLQTGKLRWKSPFKNGRKGGSIVAVDDRIFGRNEGAMICLDLKTGEEKWRSKPKSTSGVLVYGGNVLALTFSVWRPRSVNLHVYSAENGKFLWSTNSFQRGEVFFIHNLFWIRRVELVDPESGAPEKDVFEVGLDPLTGKVRKRLRIGKVISNGCYRSVATEDYFIGTRGFRFVSTKDGKVSETFNGGRHACKIGIVPANGLIYSFAQHCGCEKAALRGAIAFAPATHPDETDRAQRLFKGPAFGKAESTPRRALPTPHSNWSTFRHDSQRSSGTKVNVPTDFKLLWQAVVDDSPPPDPLLKTDWIGNPLGGDLLTQPTVADGLVFVSLVESHRVVALDAKTGETRWSFTAGGRLDTPPTLHEGLCLFGCADGRVYCLRAADGKLVWWYRAAPRERRVLAYGQLESKWPVVGGVLMENGVAYCAAGRTSALVGGLHTYAIDPKSGKVLSTKQYTGKGIGMCDLLVSTGNRILKANGGPNGRLTIPLVVKPKAAKSLGYLGISRKKRNRTGFALDRSWKWAIQSRAARYVLDAEGNPPSAKSLIYKYNTMLRRGVGNSFRKCWGQQVVGMADQNRAVGYTSILRSRGWGGTLKARVDDKTSWTQEIKEPFQIESMVLAKDILFVAGPSDRYQPSKEGFLWALSLKDGKKLNEIKLDSPPVSEGMAAVEGRLLVATRDGKVLCFGK